MMLKKNVHAQCLKCCCEDIQLLFFTTTPMETRKLKQLEVEGYKPA